MPPAASRPDDQPLAVLFACGLNSVRSPIAAALFGQIFGRSIYVGSAGGITGQPAIQLAGTRIQPPFTGAVQFLWQIVYIEPPDASGVLQHIVTLVIGAENGIQ